MQSLAFWRLRSKRESIAEKGAHDVAKIGVRAIPQLTELLKQDSWFVRRSSIRALSKMGLLAVVPLLAEFLEDENQEVQEAARQGLEKIGTPESLHYVGLYEQRQRSYRNSHYFFVTNIATQGTRTVAHAVCLSPKRAMDISIEPSDAWMLDSGEKVRIEPHFIESIGTGVDAKGNRITFADDMPVLSNIERSVIRASENHITFLLNTAYPYTLPFFIGYANDRQPLQFAIRVRLSVTRWEDYPDVVASVKRNYRNYSAFALLSWIR